MVLRLVYEEAIEEFLPMPERVLLMQYDELDVAFISKEIRILDASMPARRDGKH